MAAFVDFVEGLGYGYQREIGNVGYELFLSGKS
jgi:hypothetical protein